MKKGSGLALAALVLLLSCIVFFLPSCADNVKVVDNINVINNTGHIDASASDSETFVFGSSSAEAEKIEAGSYIVAASTPDVPQGFLKKVESVSVSSEGTRVNVSDAQLTDVVEEAGVELEGRLNLENDNSNLSGGTFSDNTPYNPLLKRSSVGLTVYGDARPLDAIPVCSKQDVYIDFNNVDIDGKAKINGCVGFTSDFVFKMAIENAKMTEADFTVTSTAASELDVELTAAEVDVNFQIELTKFDISPIVFFIGPVPVVIVPEVRLVLGLDGKLNVNITAKGSHEISTTTGLRFTDNKWQSVKERTHNFDFHMPVLNGNVNAKVYVGPEVDMMFYGIAGPGANVHLFTRVEADFDHYTSYGNTWEIWAGLNVGARFSVTLFDQTLFKISEPNLIGYEGLVASSEYNGLAEPGTGRIIGVIGDAVNGKFVTGDEIVANNLSGILVDLTKAVVPADDDPSDGGEVEDDAPGVDEANEEPVWKELKVKNFCLDGGPGLNLTTVKPAACNGKDNQKWWIDPVGRIHLKSKPDMCLDGMGVTSGVHPVMIGCHEGNNQRWLWNDTSRHSLFNNSKYLTYKKGFFGLIDSLVLDNYSGDENQQFYFGE